MLDDTVSHPLSGLCPIGVGVGVVVGYGEFLLQSGKIRQVHQLGLLAGGIVVVAMAETTLAVALGRGEDAIVVIGGGVSGLGIVARVLR